MPDNKCRCCCKRVTLQTRGAHYLGIGGVFECPHCGAVQGTCHKGDRYLVVKPAWHEGPSEHQVYFDLTTLGSVGVERFHGWMDANTRRIVQVG